MIFREVYCLSFGFRRKLHSKYLSPWRLRTLQISKNRQLRWKNPIKRNWKTSWKESRPISPIQVPTWRLFPYRLFLPIPQRRTNPRHQVTPFCQTLLRKRRRTPKNRIRTPRPQDNHHRQKRYHRPFHQPSGVQQNPPTNWPLIQRSSPNDRRQCQRLWRRHQKRTLFEYFDDWRQHAPVSYTHLTLPTICSL